MPFFGMLRHLAPVRTNMSGELSASIIKVTRIGELGTTLVLNAVKTSNLTQFHLGRSTVWFLLLATC
jgi:hypothetical protein